MLLSVYVTISHMSPRWKYRQLGTSDSTTEPKERAEVQLLPESQKVSLISLICRLLLREELKEIDDLRAFQRLSPQTARAVPCCRVLSKFAVRSEAVASHARCESYALRRVRNPVLRLQVWWPKPAHRRERFGRVHPGNAACTKHHKTMSNPCQNCRVTWSNMEQLGTSTKMYQVSIRVPDWSWLIHIVICQGCTIIKCSGKGPLDAYRAVSATWQHDETATQLLYLKSAVDPKSQAQKDCFTAKCLWWHQRPVFGCEDLLGRSLGIVGTWTTCASRTCRTCLLPFRRVPFVDMSWT